MMTRLLLACCFLALLVQPTSAQLRPGQIDPERVPVPDHHYVVEYAYDVPTQPARWAQGQSGLNVAFASADELYLRSEVPVLTGETQAWQDSGWRGERLNAQLLVWSADSLEQVRLTVSDLVNDAGRSLDRSVVTPYLVRYVLSNYPYQAQDTNCGVVASDSTYLMPDRLEPIDRFDLPGRSVRPVWMTIDIPRDAEPGTYAGTVTVRTTEATATLRLSVNIEPLVLPEPGDWSFRLDLWQNPWVVANHFRLEPWSDAHLALLREHMRPYAEAGGTFITTYSVHSPWSDNSYAVEGAMIESIRHSDGSWAFDYEIFDTYVELAMDLGIDEAITVYTPIPWMNRFRYLDEETGNYVYEQWAPETPAFTAYWNSFLDDLRAHLEQKGWFDITYLGINENPMDQTLAAIRVIDEHSADWKITYAGDWHPELDQLVDDYSPIISKEPTLSEVRGRSDRGATTTFYVCCTPPQPNNFVFSDPIEGRYLGWYTAAMGYDGFLRWAYDAWPEDPDRDARHAFWPAGDTHLIYPGGLSSIRMEKLREGIVDYEKIRILFDRAGSLPEGQGRDLLRELRAHLDTFVAERDYSLRVYDVDAMEVAVHRGRDLMQALTELVAD